MKKPCEEPGHTVLTVTGRDIELHDELPWDLAAAYDEIADRSMGRTEAGDEIIPLILNG